MSRKILRAHQQRTSAEVWRVPLPRRGSPRLAVVFPNHYGVGMANLGFHALLEELSRLPAVVERCFLPDDKLLDLHQRSGMPMLSLESGTPLKQFEAIFFSVSFEPDYVGLAHMLRLSGMEPLASRRPAGSPLVVAGGLAPTLNPEPLADFCDLVGVGEAEVLAPPLLELLLERLPRQELLYRAGSLPGWYAPQLSPEPPAKPSRVVRQHSPLLTRPCHPVVLSPDTVFSSHVDLEISRGCRWRCRFCAAGQVVTPYRELGLEELKPALGWALQQRPGVGLVGTDVSDHGGLGEIAAWIEDQGGEVRLPSMRVENLSRPGSSVSRLLARRPPRTLTMAVEAASEGLRNALNKRLDDGRLRRAAELVAGAGVQNLKIYLLTAIPGERWEEVEAMGALARDLLRWGPPGRLTLSVTGLVPKAGTPLQWEPAPDRQYLRRVRSFLRKDLPRGRVELLFESPDWVRWQALLSIGGREVGQYVLVAAQQGWRRALARATKEVSCLSGQARSFGEDLPWSFVDHGCPVEVLWQERLNCLGRVYVPPTRIGDLRPATEKRGGRAEEQKP